MKGFAVLILSISMYSINSMEIQKRVWENIPHNEKLTREFAVNQLAQALRNSDPSKPRLPIFASITQELDQQATLQKQLVRESILDVMRQKELERKDQEAQQQKLLQRKKLFAIDIKTFIATKNCNKRKDCSPYGYILHNKNGIITETKNGQNPTCFNAKDVRDVLIYDNFAIKFIF